MTDRPGTVRRSSDGVVAVCADVNRVCPWLCSKPLAICGDSWRNDDEVSSWEVVYRPPAPPHPVGTVMRRGGKTHYGKPFWEVAVNTAKGWTVTECGGTDWLYYDGQPQDDCDGAWEVLYVRD